MICTIIPPHIYDHISQSPDPHTQNAAKSGNELTSQIREQRHTRANAPARATSRQILHRTIYNADTQTNLPGAVIRVESARTSADIATEQAYEGAGIVWHFYKSVFHRDSIDNAGMHLESTVHYGEGYNNAMWDGQQMIYGDGDGQLFHNFTGAIDVIAHELTHGVTQHSTGLIYQGQSGAINEHLSDVFGLMIKRKVHGHAANPADDWLIGEHLDLLNRIVDRPMATRGRCSWVSNSCPLRPRLATHLAGCGKMRPIEVDFPGLLRYHLIKSPRNFEVAIDAIQG